MKMKKVVGSTGKNINMMRGFMCQSEAATAVLCSMTTTDSRAAVVLPRGRVLHPPPHSHQRSTLVVTNNEKYMRLVQRPRPTFDDSSSSSSSSTIPSSKKLLFTGGAGSASLALAPITKTADDDDQEKAPKPLVMPAASSALSSSNTHVFQVVVMRVSLHCQGCASKVKKHLSKMEGVTSFSIDLESKKVTVMGNVSPVGVLESVSKIKRAEFWPC